ncbi:hypothetical protein KAR91_54655 [Candidatus Pacearchaeota archaeon]|nr:hypothetical protein [Candidatus Pacearchaeota archaeon]
MEISSVLMEMGVLDGDQFPASDMSSYPHMVETWVNPAVSIPTEAAMQAVWDAGATDRQAEEDAQALADTMADTESPGILARKLEDVIDHLENGTPLSDEAKSWVIDRSSRR